MAYRFLRLKKLTLNPKAPSSLLLHSPSPPRYSPSFLSPLPLFSFNSPASCNHWIIARDLSSGSVNLVISDGKPKFEIQERDPPKKHKWKTKKRLKMQRKREKTKRKAANRRDPRCINPKGKKMKKQKFPTAEARIKYKIEKAKLKEALLVEKLKKYEVPQAHGPNPKEDPLTGEERFYMKKMSQKSSNYVPIGRRGIFGGVILNMHMHWKKHETVKVVCKPCKLGQVNVYAEELARLSGGLPIEIVGNDTIIFYRGRNYAQPEVMSPVDTLSKKRALEKSKYEQSLETVRRFIAIAEKELELYHRHIALYGDPNIRNSDFVYGDERKNCGKILSEAIDGSNLNNSDSSSDETDSDFKDFSSDETDLDASCRTGDGEELAGTETDSDDESPFLYTLDSREDLRKTTF